MHLSTHGRQARNARRQQVGLLDAASSCKTLPGRSALCATYKLNPSEATLCNGTAEPRARCARSTPRSRRQTCAQRRPARHLDILFLGGPRSIDSCLTSAYIRRLGISQKLMRTPRRRELQGFLHHYATIRLSLCLCAASYVTSIPLGQRPRVAARRCPS